MADNLSKTATNRIRFGGYVPDNIIGYKEGIRFNKFMWQTPAHLRMILFDHSAENKNIKSGQYWVPGLIWIFENDLQMYAYKHWDGKDTELFWAPFMNISHSSVCLGSANDFLDLESESFKTFESVIDGVEYAFWNSKFSHMGSKQDQIAGNIEDMYMKSRQHPPFEFMVPANKTINNLINEAFSS